MESFSPGRRVSFSHYLHVCKMTRTGSQTQADLATMSRDHSPTAFFCGSFELTRGRTMPPPTLSSIVTIGAPRNERGPEMRTLGSQIWISVAAWMG
jgi:hypothetical protein